MTYTCIICRHVNHSSRYHCQTCGTTPSHYSVINSPATFHHGGNNSMGILNIIPVAAAKGCDRVESHRAVKVNLRTVPLDYYGER